MAAVSGSASRRIFPRAKAGILESGSLNPQKARILLQLALSKTTNREEIRRIFEQY